MPKRIMPSFDCSLPKYQQGAATLLVVLVLSLIMTVVSLSVAQTGIMEQKMTGNDLRAREAREAAEAGLEYGIAWSKKNGIPNTVTCTSSSLSTGCPTTLTTVTGSTTGESYRYLLTYTKSANFVRVTTEAQGVNDNSIAGPADAWIKQISFLTTKGETAPPIVVNGTLNNVTGTPEIHTGNPPGTAIISSNPVAQTTTGNLNKNSSSPLGATVQDAFPSTSTPAWNYVFSISLSEAMATAVANGYDYPNNTLPSVPASGKEAFYVWDSDSHITNDYGSAARPVVIIVKNGRCPNINGNVTIYGFVYFPANCSDQGWGNATIHGSIISEGNIVKLTANSIIISNGIGGGGTDTSSFIYDATRIPGTWKDF